MSPSLLPSPTDRPEALAVDGFGRRRRPIICVDQPLNWRPAPAPTISSIPIFDGAIPTLCPPPPATQAHTASLALPSSRCRKEQRQSRLYTQRGNMLPSARLHGMLIIILMINVSMIHILKQHTLIMTGVKVMQLILIRI